MIMRIVVLSAGAVFFSTAGLTWTHSEAPSPYQRAAEYMMQQTVPAGSVLHTYTREDRATSVTRWTVEVDQNWEVYCEHLAGVMPFGYEEIDRQQETIVFQKSIYHDATLHLAATRVSENPLVVSLEFRGVPW